MVFDSRIGSLKVELGLWPSGWRLRMHFPPPPMENAHPGCANIVDQDNLFFNVSKRPSLALLFVLLVILM